MEGQVFPVLTRLFGAAFLASVVAPGPFQDGEADRLKTEIRSTIEEIHAVRGQRLSSLDSAELDTSALSAQIERLETDLEEVRVYVEDSRRKSKDLEERMALADEFSERASAFLDELSQRASGVLVSWKPNVEAGVSWGNAARGAQVDRLVASLANAGEERERALLEFWAFLSEELRLSHTLDERNELVTLDGGPRSEHAYVLRLGLLQELFVSEDGSLAGVHIPEEGWSELGLPTSESIKLLLNIARGKAAADLASAPFPSDRVRRGN